MNIFKKYILIFSIILILMASCGLVSASSDINDTYDISVDLNNDVNIVTTSDVELIDTNEDNYLENDLDSNTFSDNTSHNSESNTILDTDTKECDNLVSKTKALSSNRLSDSDSYILTSSYKEFNLGEDIIITGYLKDSNGNPISSEKIFISLGSELYCFTDDKGMYYFNLSGLGLSTGLYAYNLHSDNEWEEEDWDEDSSEISHNIVVSAKNYFTILNHSISKKNPSFSYTNMTTETVLYNIDGMIGKYFIFTLIDDEGRVLANQRVEIGFNGKVYNRTTDENGSCRLQINLQVIGEYPIIANFVGNDEFNSVVANGKIIVNRQNLTLTTANKTYMVDAFKYSLSAGLKTSYGNPISGKLIIFSIYGENYTAFTNSKGIATVKVSFSDVKKGDNTFYVYYLEDDTFNSASTSAILTIRPTSVDFHLVSNSIDYEDKLEFYFDKNLDEYDDEVFDEFLDNFSNLISNETVYLNINNKNYSAVIDDDCIVRFDLDGLKSGVYNSLLNFNGNNWCNPFNKTFIFSISPLPTNIIANDLIVNDTNKNLEIALCSNDHMIPNKNLDITIANKTYTAKTNLLGLASLDISNLNLAKGNYSVMINFYEDGCYLSSNASCSVIVENDLNNSNNDENYSIDANLDLSLNGNVVIISLNDKNNMGIPNTKLDVFVNGIKSTLITDSNGKISVPVSGNSTVKAIFIDKNGSCISSTLITNEIEKLVEKNNTIEVPVYINNTIEKIVEKNNTVYVNVTPNRTATRIIYSNMTTVSVPAADGRIGKYFEVTLVDANGKPLANKDIAIGFNGKSYPRTTNATGGAKLQINLPAQGKYTFAIAFLGDDNYTGSFEVALITVNPQVPKLTASAKSFKSSAKTKSISATFKTANGNAVKGKQISFTVNGKTYTAKTNSKGVATVNISLNKKGTYSAVAKFAGDTSFKATSTKFNVKIA